MDINKILTKFAQEELVLARNEPQREKIKKSLDHLQNVLTDGLGKSIKEYILFGSYARNTILPREYDQKSDVDLMVMFDKQNYDYSPNTYRKWIHDILQSAYPNSLSKKDAPVVKLQLNHIMFDVVPAYSKTNFWDGEHIYIPDKSGGWMETTPNDINKDLSRMNQSYGGNIVRNVIRLCKHWNAKSGYRFESYLMEKRIVHMLFWNGDNLYTKFLSVLNNLAGSDDDVAKAIRQIKSFEPGIFSKGDPYGQLEGLERLLPGLSGVYSD